MRVIILSGENHGFDKSAEVIHEFLDPVDGLEVRLDSDKDVLTSPSLREFDVLLFGTGFTRAVVGPDGEVVRERDLTSDQEDGLFDYVAGGRGLVGVHGTAWWVDARAVTLLGGHANWHPPGLTFTVNIEDSSHPVTRGLSDFEVEDEIYMSAWDPGLRVLATAEWSGKQHPMAWVRSYEAGRVFYTTLGHTADTFRRPAMQRLMIQGVRWAGST